ncbi:MAG: LD-carboxypeptidase [Patescibacteria group bacterium]
MSLPKKLTDQSIINLVYTSSLLYSDEVRDFSRTLKRLQREFPKTNLLEPKREGFLLSYLAGSEQERLRAFRRAIKDGDWILPVSGGTGCVDILRHLSQTDLEVIGRRRPIISGFSDSTALCNFLYFKTRLQTFVQQNADALYSSAYSEAFFSVLQGKQENVSFTDSTAHWLTSAVPTKIVEGVAIGGNFSTFRDLLDVCEIRPRSWEPYILFIEELDVDIEDLHRIIIALDARGIFKHLVALVVGRINDHRITKSIQELLFGKSKKPGAEVLGIKNVFEYLIDDVISDRIEEHDPLYILKINDFGHFGSQAKTKNIFIPIGAKTRIHPDGKIEFVGPFVE